MKRLRGKPKKLLAISMVLVILLGVIMPGTFMPAFALIADEQPSESVTAGGYIVWEWVDPAEGNTAGDGYGLAEGNTAGGGDGPAEGNTAGGGDGPAEGNTAGGGDGSAEGNTAGDGDGPAEGNTAGDGDGSAEENNVEDESGKPGQGESDDFDSIEDEPEEEDENEDPEEIIEKREEVRTATGSEPIVAFTFGGESGALVVEMAELHSGTDANAILLRGVYAVCENGEDLSSFIYVKDDGGFAGYVRDNFSGISPGGNNGGGIAGSPAIIGGGAVIGGGWPSITGGGAAIVRSGIITFGAMPFHENESTYAFPASGFASGPSGTGEYAFETMVIYAVRHPESGEDFISNPRELRVRFMGFAAASESVINVADFDGLHNAVRNAAGPVVLNVTQDIDLISPINIGEGKEITLQGNGIIRVIDNFWHFILDKGVLNLNGNIVLTHLHPGRPGGGVTMNSAIGRGGDFNMYEGEISGCGNSAVFVTGGGTFNMHGGRISNNSAFSGGGVRLMTGACSFYMRGGEISGNKVDDVNNTVLLGGGGLYLAEGYFEMHGGKIIGNTAADSGGGILSSNGTVRILGGEISGNTAAAGSGVFMSGGQIGVAGRAIVGSYTDDNAITRRQGTPVEILAPGLVNGAHINIDTLGGDALGTVIAARADGSDVTGVEAGYFHYLGDGLHAVRSGSSIALGLQITFNANDGTVVGENAFRILHDENLLSSGYSMPYAAREGYRFDGWATALGALNADFDGDTPITGNITVFAVWTAIEPEPPANKAENNSTTHSSETSNTGDTGNGENGGGWTTPEPEAPPGSGGVRASPGSEAPPSPEERGNGVMTNPTPELPPDSDGEPGGERTVWDIELLPVPGGGYATAGYGPDRIAANYAPTSITDYASGSITDYVPDSGLSDIAVSDVNTGSGSERTSANIGRPALPGEVSILITESQPPLAAGFGMTGYGDVPRISIGNSEVFLFAPLGEAAWALQSLVLCALGLVLAVMSAIHILPHKKRGRDSATEVQNESEEGHEMRLQNGQIWLAAVMIMAIAGILAFVLTQDMSGMMALVNTGTIISAAIFAAEIIALVFALKSPCKKDKKTAVNM